MRLIAILFLTLYAGGADADPPACPYKVVPIYEHLLTPEQRNAAFAGRPNGDPVVDEAIIRLNAFKQAPSFPSGKSKSISWEQAKTLILLGAVRQTFSYRGGLVSLVTSRGTAYDTKLPSGVDLGDVLNSVDPCFLYITREIVD
jgi:hypothetical protein